MKTMQELYDEFFANDELKKAFAEAMKAGKLEDFLKANGCEATAEESRKIAMLMSSETLLYF